MARPLRIEYEGAVYHVTSRGNALTSIFLNNKDRNNFLSIFGKVIERYSWKCYSYCLMNNHYHLLIETPNGNLSTGMRQLNGVYTQYFNRIHHSAGHLFQGRYKSFLIDKDNYAIVLSAYISLNPVRARIVGNPGEWEWSSYRALVGLSEKPEWLDTDFVTEYFGNKRTGVVKFKEFIKSKRK